MILPSMISTGVIGIAKMLSIVPRSISPLTESAVKISMVIVRMVPTRPGTILNDVLAAGLARVGADLERGSRAVRNGAVVLERGLHQRAERSHGRAGGHRVGRVGGDQERGTIAAAHRTLEISWNFDCEQHRAGREQVIELGLVLDDMGDVEICGVLNRLEDRTAEIALLLQQHRGG